MSSPIDSFALRASLLRPEDVVDAIAAGAAGAPNAPTDAVMVIPTVSSLSVPVTGPVSITTMPVMRLVFNLTYPRRHQGYRRLLDIRSCYHIPRFMETLRTAVFQSWQFRPMEWGCGSGEFHSIVFYKKGLVDRQPDRARLNFPLSYHRTAVAVNELSPEDQQAIFTGFFFLRALPESEWESLPVDPSCHRFEP